MGRQNETLDAIQRLQINNMDDEKDRASGKKSKGKGKKAEVELTDEEKAEKKFYELLDKGYDTLQQAKIVIPRCRKLVKVWINECEKGDPIKEAKKKVSVIKHKKEKELMAQCIKDVEEALKLRDKGEVAYAMRLKCWGVYDRLVKNIKPGEIEPGWR